MKYSVSNLRYRLLDKAIPLSPMKILSERSLLWNDWSVTFFVLGASHAVLLRRGDAELLELLACLPQYATPHETEAHTLLTASCNSPERLCISAPALNCQIEIAPFSFASSLSFSATENDRLQGDFENESRLELAYPILSGAVAPVTRVGWKAAPESLLIETVHTYPEEGAGVRSRSLFLPKAGAKW